MTMNQLGRIYKTPVPVSDDPAAPLTMSSRQIAELLGSRHDKVKQSMDRLAEKGVITFTPLGEKSSGGRPGTVYDVKKRDSFVVVAQLSPEFTARLVDRWQELEQDRAEGGFSIPRTLGDALRLAAEQARQLESLEGIAKAHGGGKGSGR